jgi:hypothetical protein
MIVVHRLGAFRFVIYPNDQVPAHVHIMGGGAEAKIQIVGPDAPKVMKRKAFGPADLRRVVDEVAAVTPELLERWLEIHGTSDGRQS